MSDFAVLIQEELEDTKGVIRIRISKKNRKHNGHKKRTKRQKTIYKTYT
jgi:peptidyl-tRNA hydrolase